MMVESVELVTRSGTAGLRSSGFLRPRNASAGAASGGMQEYRSKLRLPPGLSEYFRPGDRVEALLPTQGAKRRLAGSIVAVSGERVIVRLRYEARIIDHLLLEFLAYPGRPVPRFRVPLSAILNPTGDQAYLMRIVSPPGDASGAGQGHLAERVPVTVIDRAPRGGRIEVIGELANDERVVVRGHANLLHGESVEPLAEAML
ncbi:MAG: hypothetical protein NXI24_04605 [bacterium]|nr:hypothetical protein [bacterium]